MKTEVPTDLFPQIADVIKQLGAKSPSMDDFARQLGKSKKTLYKYFSSKEDMLKALFEHYLLKERTSLLEEVKSKYAQNAILQIIYFFSQNIEFLKQFPPTVHFEIQRYYPEAFKLVENFKYQVLQEFVEQNLSLGIDQGVYRPEMNKTMVARLFISSTDSLFNEQLFPSLEFPKIILLKEHFMLYINGFLSESGIQEFKHSEQIIQSL